MKTGVKRRITVLKIGGSLLEPGSGGTAVLDQAVTAWEAGEEFVIVHGGGTELSRWLERLGIPTGFHDGQRVTTPETIPVALMILGGLMNRRIVEAFVSRGCPAIGLTGADGGGTTARAVEDRSLGAVGRVVSVNATFYTDLIEARRLPVVSSLAWSPVDGWLNINADLMAASLAAGLDARRLILMTDVSGVRDGNGAHIGQLSVSEIDSMIAAGDAGEGMIPKLTACRAALEAGVDEVLILGPNGHNLGLAMSGAAATGTHVVREKTEINRSFDLPGQARLQWSEEA